MDLGLILTLVLIAFIVVSAFVAFVRGLKKSIFRFITVILSAFLAFMSVIIFKSMLGGEALISSINSFLAASGMQDILNFAASSPLLEEVILKTVGGLVAPILFFVMFIGYSVATYVIYFIISLLFMRKPKEKEDDETVKASDKKEDDDEEEEKGKGCLAGIFALIVGFAQGIVVTAAFVLTIISYTLIVPEVAPKLEGSDALKPSQKGSVTETCQTIEKANNAALISVYRSCGLENAAHGLMDFEIATEDETVKVNMASEITHICDLVFIFMDLSSSPIAEYGEEEAILVKDLGKTFTESKVLTLAGAELLHNVTETWKKNETFSGIAKPYFGEDMDPLFTKLIEIFNESTKSTETFSEDVVTVADLVSVFAKHGILSASTKMAEEPEALFDILAKNGVISEITLTLNVNDRMNALVPEITNLGLKTLAHSLGIADNKDQIYNEALVNIAHHIKETGAETDTVKRADALKPLIKTEFENIGVKLEQDYLDLLAPALITDFGDFSGEITPEFISEFFDVYNESLSDLAVLTSGESADVALLGSSASQKTYTFPKYAFPDNLLSSGAFAAAQGSLDLINTAPDESKDTLTATKDLIAGMRSSTTATINRATINDFLVSSDCVITDPEAESAALESIVKEVVAIMDALKDPNNNGIDTIKNFSTRLGSALDNLSHTQMYGADKTFTLFTGILQSKTLRDTTKITVPETIKLTDKHRSKADTVSFGSLMNVLTSTVDVITSMQNSQLTTDSIENLIGNLTPDNSEIIKEVITVERIEELGIPKENAETTTELMGDLFDNLGKIEDPETYESEAKAVENIINIGIAAKDILSGNNGGSGDNGESGEGGSEAPEAPKKNLFTPTVNKDEGNGEGGSGNATPEAGSLGCTADEMVENIMSSSAVCDTIVSTVKEKEKTDPFGIHENMTEDDKDAIKNACDNYLAQNSDKSEEELKKIQETLDSINMLLGITGWTPSMPVPPIA